MISLFKQRKGKFNTKKDFLYEFFATAQHEWIASDRYLRASFEEFFYKMSLENINKIYKNCDDIWFVTSSGRFSCTFQTSSTPVIIIFPELLKELKSFYPDMAHAVLAHEIGHIVNNHHKRSLDLIESQVEADNFAIELGYAKELEKFLLELPESIEKRTRLVYLSSKVFSSDNSF
ncbi:MAG: M48 family metalloprotease [Bacteriovoracaceae bacterium]|jgi:Zn-dependent protease with chaperone function|nr:M48 family metalloprotease [Bacteriovoracaceae bacterium]